MLTEKFHHGFRYQTITELLGEVYCIVETNEDIRKQVLLSARQRACKWRRRRQRLGLDERSESIRINTEFTQFLRQALSALAFDCGPLRPCWNHLASLIAPPQPGVVPSLKYALP